jgi:hypothetical protein
MIAIEIRVNGRLKATCGAAHNQAATYIESQGWVIEAIENPMQVASDPSGPSQKYVDQANVDGECYVFHTWPIEDHSEELLH